MQTITLGDVTVRWISVSDMENNVYLLTSAATGAQVLIDAAADAPAIRELIAAGSGSAPVAILTTHRHWDHVRALAEIAGTGAEGNTIPVYAGADDAQAVAEESGAPVDRQINHLEDLAFPGFTLHAVKLRGHTPGSIAYVLADGAQTIIFSGDSLFPGGPGKTWNEADFDSLMADLQARIFAVYPDDALVLPGHGDTTTLGAERPHIPEWLARRW
ncbi:MBL fold metallo-hydrolase [Brevibacterium sp. 91QC2O2]|jgi:glyoxylase-like metal-dependent hydrolase (beta-lactamase superfamily II)|uniref:MBL fold metallo-hydrolase n=1 Tax=Brevibacterium TaxID=1696 RepID=UPI00211CA90C|nr:MULTISPECIES: MBL fold metallo-hydrolase [unclassified Brevibacterium]MCQ9368401.1 MBL fold metallo-hydrolase [Brevibacterium sp. 91QC2O2]MCQ9384729.1 MBL fold metallo-hydrolase [Brevibacterium sp. 68QC2CO]